MEGVRRSCKFGIKESKRDENRGLLALFCIQNLKKEERREMGKEKKKNVSPSESLSSFACCLLMSDVRSEV